MYIKQEVIEKLQAQGIRIAHYPQETWEEWYQLCYNQCRQRYIDYYKPHVGDNPYANKLFDTMDQLEQRAEQNARMEVDRKARNTYDADVLYIRYEDKMICKKIRVKSEPVTEEMVLKAIEKDRKAYSGPYGDFALKMQKLLKRNKLSGSAWIYPTTYGIRVWVFYNWNEKECISAVSNILTEAGIQFRNEYSDAQYVYRYIVSKAEANRLKIDNAA